jgi:CIC family chloride channel protein
MELIASSRDSYFPMVDSEGRLSGIVSIQNVREFMLDSHDLCDLVVAKEIATENVITVNGRHNLNEAMEKFSMIDIEQLPVVAYDDPLKIEGMISRMDVIASYKKEVLKKTEN